MTERASEKQSGASREGVPVGAVHHIAFAAKQYDRSVEFFRRGLDASVLMEFEENGKRVAFLEVGGSAGAGACRIELFDAGGEPQGGPNVGPPGASTGNDLMPGAWMHIAVRVADVESAAHRLAGAGGQLVEPPTSMRLRPPGRDEGPEVRYAFVRGPDGELIELIAGEGI